jgi:hypothetical protein
VAPAAESRSRRWLVLGGVAAAIVLAGVLAFLLLGGDDGGDGFVSECPAAGDPAVCITDVSFDGDELSVRFAAHDVDLGGDLLPIFFLTDVSEDDAGSVSDRTADWQDWSPQSPFQGVNDAGQEGFTGDDIDTGQTSICVLVGDSSGQVAPGTGNCAGLPDAP